MIRNVLKDRPDLRREQLERTRRLMDEHAGDCLVVDHEKHVDDLALPDPDDRHVLAVRFEVEADGIITWNLRDFPAETVGPFGIEIRTRDQLIGGLLEENERSVVGAMKEHRQVENPAQDTC